MQTGTDAPTERLLCLFQKSRDNIQTLAFDCQPRDEYDLRQLRHVPIVPIDLAFELTTPAQLPGFRQPFTHFVRPFRPGQATTLSNYNRTVQIRLQAVRQEDALKIYTKYFYVVPGYVVPGIISCHQARLRLLQQDDVLSLPVEIRTLINMYAAEPPGEERRFHSDEIQITELS
jgi:hypothetical protein